MEIKKIPVEEAVGCKFAHDLTQIIPGEFKGPRFRRGETIKEEYLPVLESMGKRQVYIFDLDDDYLHEDEAASRISRAVQGTGINLTAPQEGKIYLTAANDGLLKVDKELLFAVNCIEDVLVTASHNNLPVEQGTKLAGVRVNPLVIEEAKVSQVEELVVKKDLFTVLSFSNPKVGIVVTGNEVYSGQIEDKFLPTIKRKTACWGGEVLETIYVPDEKERITEAILQVKDKGAEIIIVSGGMSVDADDVTPDGIKDAGVDVVTYGAPVLPGNKLMVAYLDGIPLLGLPAAIIFYEVTVLDLIYPRLLAGEEITKGDIIRLSHGGLCHHCRTCQYPHCSFGKGV